MYSYHWNSYVYELPEAESQRKSIYVLLCVWKSNLLIFYLTNTVQQKQIYDTAHFHLDYRKQLDF